MYMMEPRKLAPQKGKMIHVSKKMSTGVGHLVHPGSVQLAPVRHRDERGGRTRRLRAGSP
jgi:hypothetical protein